MPERIAESIHGLRHLFSTRQYRIPEVVDLSHMEGRVLCMIQRQPDTTLSEITARLARDKGQVARLIAALKERGLVRAQDDPANRRIQRLNLTEAGRAIHLQVRDRRARVARQAVAGLGAAEQEALLSLLDRLRQNLDAGDEPVDAR